MERSQGWLDELAGKLFLIPVEKLAERRAAMAVLGFFLGTQFRECLVYLGKVK